MRTSQVRPPTFAPPATARTSPARSGQLLRKCGCDGTPGPRGECTTCQDEHLQRQIGGAGPGARGDTAIPPIVPEVLRSPGLPLDARTRASLEPRFRHDFSNVRVHADARAAESAGAVDALAYTVGRDIVFGAHQYAPGTAEGNALLAHELAHVVQGGVVAPPTPHGMSAPGDASERSADALADSVLRGAAPLERGESGADARLFRRVGSVNCPPDVFGAPADPRAALDGINATAVDFATRTGDALAADAVQVAEEIPAAPSATLQAFEDTFGLPTAAGRGFMNRLTGQVRPSVEIALAEELRIVSRRFRFSARVLNGTVNFRCPGDATITLPGCAPGECGPNFAFSCRGGGTMALCEPFWGLADEIRAGTLVHESLHMIFGTSAPRQIGQIGEATQRGPGRNFNVAGCYEFLVDAAVGITSNAVCPPVPQDGAA